VFWIVGIVQWYWFACGGRRERLVRMCRHRDLQKLTWDADMNKKLVRAKPASA